MPEIKTSFMFFEGLEIVNQVCLK